MEISQNKNELYLYPINNDDYLGSIYVDGTTLSNSIQTVVLLDCSVSMGKHTARVIREILPLVLSKLNWNKGLDLITFATRAYWKYVTLAELPTSYITSGTKTDIAPAIGMLRGCLESIQQNYTGQPVRVLTISDGAITDQERAEELTNRLIDFLDTTGMTINSQAVRLFTSPTEQPDTKALCYLLQINNTCATNLCDITATASTETIASAIAALFQSDCFANCQTLQVEKPIILKCPWDSNGSMRILLSPGWNIFWLKLVPTGVVKLGNDNVKVNVEKELSLAKFHQIMETKLTYISDHVKILKVANTVEANRTVDQICAYFKTTEDALANKGSTPNINIISNLLDGIAKNKVVFKDFNQMAEFLRNTKNETEMQIRKGKEAQERIKQEEEKKRIQREAEEEQCRRREEEERLKREEEERLKREEEERIKRKEEERIKREEEERLKREEEERIKRKEEERLQRQEEKRIQLKVEAEAEAQREHIRREEQCRRREEEERLQREEEKRIQLKVEAEAEAQREYIRREEQCRRREEEERLQREEEKRIQQKVEAEAEAQREHIRREEECRRREEEERLQREEEKRIQLKVEAEAEAQREHIRREEQCRRREEEERRKREEEKRIQLKVEAEAEAERERIRREEQCRRREEEERRKREEEKRIQVKVEAKRERIRWEEQREEFARIRQEEERVRLDEEEKSRQKLKLEEEKLQRQKNLEAGLLFVREAKENLKDLDPSSSVQRINEKQEFANENDLVGARTTMGNFEEIAKIPHESRNKRSLITTAAKTIRKFAGAIRSSRSSDFNPKPIQTVFILHENVSVTKAAKKSWRFSEKIIPLVFSKISNENSQLVHLLTVVTEKTPVVQMLQSILQTLDANKPIRILVLTNVNARDRQQFDNFTDKLIEFINESNFSLELQVIRIASESLQSTLGINNASPIKYQLLDIDSRKSNALIAIQIVELFHSDSFQKHEQEPHRIVNGETIAPSTDVVSLDVGGTQLENQRSSKCEFCRANNQKHRRSYYAIYLVIFAIPITLLLFDILIYSFKK